MANEATIRSSLRILKGNLDYASQPTAFQADVSSACGPTPGLVDATTAGVDIDLSLLTQPGLCRIMNLDDTNFVEVGIWDGATFYPLMELLAGESYIIRLARDLTEEFGTGTGTTGEAVNTVRVKGDTATVCILFEAFET